MRSKDRKCFAVLTVSSNIGFQYWFCRACSLSLPCLPLFSLAFSISLEASWQYYTADFPQEIYFKVIPHFWERFIDRTRKHIWHSQPAESVSGWLLVTWPSASPLAFFFSQATIGHSEIRYLSSNRSTFRGFFFKELSSAALVLPLKAWKSKSRQLNPASLSTFCIQDQIMTAFHKTQQKTSPTMDQYLGFSMWTYHSLLQSSFANHYLQVSLSSAVPIPCVSCPQPIQTLFSILLL